MEVVGEEIVVLVLAVDSVAVEMDSLELVVVLALVVEVAERDVWLTDEVVSVFVVEIVLVCEVVLVTGVGVLVVVRVVEVVVIGVVVA